MDDYRINKYSHDTTGMDIFNKKKPEQNLGCNRSDFIYGIDVISGMQNGMSMDFTRRLGSFIRCSSIRFRYFMQLYSRYYFS